MENNDNIKFAIKPYNGLGNRFRALASALIFSNYFDTKLKINWTATRGFDDTPLGDLIDLWYLGSKYNIEMISDDEFVEIEKEAFRVNEKFENVHENHAYTHLKEIEDSEKQKRQDNLNDFFKKRCKNISVRTSNNLVYIFQPEISSFIPCVWSSYGEILRDFKPSQKILDLSDNVITKFKDKTLGVHIRRGDATNTDFYSEHKDKYSIDTKTYLNRTEELLNSEYDNVFITTDCEESLSEFKKKFKDRCVNYDKNFKESVWHKKKEGQIDARVEQYLLSKTNYLLTSQWSTFSDFARIYSNIKTEML